MKNFTIVSHDAGGAEILSHWLKNKKCFFSTVLKGPAINIFKNNGIEITNYQLIEGIEKSNIVITGTSWQSNLEKEAIFLSKKMGKYTISILDHWVNYKERFTYKEHLNLPDEIWVTDKYAFSLANNLFKKTIIKKKLNYYLLSIKKEIENKESKKRKISKNYFNSNLKGLYLAENISEHALMYTGDENGFGYTEHQSLKFLLDNIKNLKLNIKDLKIRPHPSENADKYEWCKTNSLIYEISNEKKLIDDILESEVIFGCESMAMVVGLLAKKKVVSCIPNPNMRCNLPFPKIINIRDLMKNKD